MIRWLAALALALSATSVAADIETCSDRSDRTAQIAACTAMIEGDTEGTDLALAHLYRCQALDLETRYADALPDCERSTELLPLDPAAHNSLAIVHLNLGNPSAALGPANTAVELLPNHGTVYNVRADVHCKLGNADAAVSDRLAAVQYGRYTPQSLQQFLKARGHYDGAIDGSFGPGSTAALRAWTEGGCQ